MVDFSNEFRKAYLGSPWHGDSAASIIARVKADQAFKRPIANAHTIAELVLHMTAWTEEVYARLMGAEVKEPEMGDWPNVNEETSAEWDVIVRGFHMANEKLISLSIGFASDDWVTSVNQRSDWSENYFELLNGLNQHHAYHSGQIALLLKF